MMKIDTMVISKKQLRSFGLLMAGLFLIIGMWPMLMKSQNVRTWALSIAGIWSAVSLAVPGILTPLYKLWMKLAEKLGWFNSRVLLSIIFYGVITPYSFVMKALGTKLLRCHFEKQSESYREHKEPREANHVLKPF